MKVPQKYYDEIFHFKGQWDVPSSCGLKIVNKDKIVVIVTELYQDNPGASITDTGKNLAQQVCNEKGFDINEIVYIECNPDTNSKLSFYNEEFFLVTFTGSKPTYRQLNAKELKKLFSTSTAICSSTGDSILKSHESRCNAIKFYVNRYHFFAPNDEMPDTSFIPAMQRRKMSRLTRLVIGIAEEIIPKDREFPLVYASRFGDWGQTLEQVLRYSKEKEISPTGFGFSVHNAVPAQLSILKKNHSAYTAISSSAHTFDAGLVESVTMLSEQEDVVYICAGEETPETYRVVLTEEFQRFAIGLWISRERADETAIPVYIDFSEKNDVQGNDFSRSQDFFHFLSSMTSPYIGHQYILRK
ncbi:MAG: beta-ketoacyl synthase chain length factor [Holophagaceae bacterium]|nr:beta-ketoacyl synthase chain length factor [Holophagaceae bacterium]